MGKIKFALVGYGHIGKRHAAIITKNPECDLVAICDELPAKVDDLKQNNNIFYYQSLDDLFNATIDFDVLSITTPNGLHEAHAIKGLKAGKHVLVEKPLALSKAACERILEESVKQQKQVFCVMQNRFSPISKWLKQILISQMLGNIYMVQVNCFWNRDKPYYSKGGWRGTEVLDGGTLFTQFSHFIDILLWLFGDVSNMSGRFANFSHVGLTEFEDSGFVQFDFVNGGMGNLSYSTSCWSKNLESSITIIAENGSVKVSGQYMTEVEYCNIKGYTLPEFLLPNPNIASNKEGIKTNHHYLFDNVIDVLNGRSGTIINTEEAMKVVEVIEQIYNLKSKQGNIIKFK